MDWLNPYRWILMGALVAAVALGVPILVHRYNDGLREEGRAEVREVDRKAAEAQTQSNRELGRMAELHLSAITTQQDKFFTKASKEIHDASAPLVACTLPIPVRVQLNAAASCARSDSPTSDCGADEVPGSR